jgi:hypothetical protein
LLICLANFSLSSFGTLVLGHCLFSPNELLVVVFEVGIVWEIAQNSSICLVDQS